MRVRIPDELQAHALGLAAEDGDDLRLIVADENQRIR
jgi:hypothetical protein